MEYELRIHSPSLTANFFKPHSQPVPKGKKLAPERGSVLLKNGQGKISTADFDGIKTLPVILNLVAEGNLRFRGDDEMEELFGTRRENYEARIAAMQDQDDRRDNPPASEDVAELTRLVGDMQSQMVAQQDAHAAEIADLKKAFADATVKKG